MAAILATNPLNDPVFAAEFAARDVGPDGSPGQVVDRAEFLLRDAGRLTPDAVLAGVLRDLTQAPEHLERASGQELRSVVAGWERLISWARAGQARVAAELMARTDGPLGRDSAGGEIASATPARAPARARVGQARPAREPAQTIARAIARALVRTMTRALVGA